MYAKRSYRPRRKTLRRRRALRRKSSGVSGRIKKYVKKEIHRNIENKMRYNYAANQSIETGQNATMTWPLLPAIDLGTGSGNRTGNCIKPVKGIFKAVINLLPYDATTNLNTQPTWVKIWVVKDLREQLQTATMNATSFANFFNGNSLSLSFQNNTLDTVLDVNTDNFRVLTTRLFKLGTASNYSGSFPNTSNQADNSPFAKQITINYGKYVRKMLKFQDTGTYPGNDNVFFVIQAVPCSGAGASGQRMIEMHYTNRFYYEDA